MVEPSIDARNGVGFANSEIKMGRRDFLKKFLPDVLYYVANKSVSREKRRRLISGYARYYYKAHRQEIENGTKAVRADWRKVEKRYFQIVSRIFKNYPWPSGHYIGFATVWHSYLRDTSHKTFYFPYRHTMPKYANKVIAHEMLHFMFFDYIKNRYGLNERSRIAGKSKDYIWELSEVFNNVIEEWNPYKKIFKFPTRLYKGTEVMFEKMKKQWEKNQDIDLLLDKLLLKP